MAGVRVCFHECSAGQLSAVVGVLYAAVHSGSFGSRAAKECKSTPFGLYVVFRQLVCM